MFDSLKNLFLPTVTPDISQSIFVILFAISLGIFLGRIKIGGISLGISAVMFSGLLLGHYGYSLDESTLKFLREFGLILFVYGIGIQVGPSFFSSLKKEGLKFNLLAISTVLLGGVITYIIFKYSGQTIENAVGLMSGAVTNTPGLGAAKSALQELQEIFPNKTFSDPAIAYAIAYPFGVFGIIVIIILAKNILKIDVTEENEKFEQKARQRMAFPIHKKCRVINEKAIGKSLKQILEETGEDSVIFSRLKHSGTHIVFSPSPETIIEERDVLMVVGYKENVDKVIEFIGRESTDVMVESEEDIMSKSLIVTKKETVHKSLEELDLYNRYDLKVTKVYRSHMELLAKPSLELFFGDKILVVGNKWSIQQAEKLIGNSEKKLLEPDFLSLFAGLILGLFVGSIPIFVPTFPVPVKLGFAAGPLLVALLLSRYGGVGVIYTYINHGAVYFMKDLGICLFFATVGIHAGHGFYDNFIKFNGWTWIAYGSLITVIPLIIMLLVGRFILKINFLQLVGLMSGTYTDPAALSFSNSYFNSDIPTQSYASVYPLVTITRILIAQLLILLCF
jgi:putative transport protein